MRALTSLSIGSVARKEKIAKQVDLHAVVALLSVATVSTSADMWHNALVLIQSLIAAKDEVKQTVIEHGFITNATLLLTSGLLTANHSDQVGRPASETCGAVLTKLLLVLSEYQGNKSKYHAPTGASWMMPATATVFSSWTGW